MNIIGYRPRKRPNLNAAVAPTAPIAAPRVVASSNRKPRKKKGPKRVKKTVAQLDAEMEDYRAHSDVNDIKP